MLNILLTYLPFRWNNKTAENRNHATKMSDSKPKPKDSTQTNPQVILKVSFHRFSMVSIRFAMILIRETGVKP